MKHYLETGLSVKTQHRHLDCEAVCDDMMDHICKIAYYWKW